MEIQIWQVGKDESVGEDLQKGCEHDKNTSNKVLKELIKQCRIS